jgi:hypothetical protein
MNLVNLASWLREALMDCREQSLNVKLYLKATDSLVS